MPEARDPQYDYIYEEISKLEVPELQARLEELRTKHKANYDGMPEEDLVNVIAILRALRKAAAAPSKTRSGNGKSKPSQTESLA